MKIACVSDLHGNLIPYPSDFWKGLEECEVLFICGDILPVPIQSTSIEAESWFVRDFRNWALDLPVKKVYFIGGNHDFWLERNYTTAKLYFSSGNKVTYLKNECVEFLSEQDYNVYKFFGSPYCHIFGLWPFMREEETLSELFSEIPEDVDILFTHDAPYGVSDVCLEGWAADGKHKGCPALRDAVVEKQPKYHFHGHLHSTNHEQELLGNTKVYNTSIVNENYDIAYTPLIIDICK